MKPAAVLLDRDGTIVVDVPYNGDPAAVVPVPGAKAALDRLRAAGLPLAIVTNQSGVGRCMLNLAQMDAVNARVEARLGPFDGWFVCPHGPDDDCDCRKPKPKLIFDAARALGVAPEACVMIGDKRSDSQAAHNAGARAITIDATHTLSDAVDEVLDRYSRPERIQ